MHVQSKSFVQGYIPGPPLIKARGWRRERDGKGRAEKEGSEKGSTSPAFSKFLETPLGVCVNGGGKGCLGGRGGDYVPQSLSGAWTPLTRTHP